MEQMLGLAETYGLQLKSEGAEINESGMDFQVVFADDESGRRWVLRRPRRDDVIKRAAAEGRVLKMLRGRLQAEVPEWQIDEPELIAYPMLAGVPAAVIDMEIRNYVWNMKHQPPAEPFVRSLAQTLADLHGIDHHAAKEAGVQVMSPDDVRQKKRTTWSGSRKSLESARCCGKGGKGGFRMIRIGKGIPC